MVLTSLGALGLFYFYFGNVNSFNNVENFLDISLPFRSNSHYSMVGLNFVWGGGERNVERPFTILIPSNLFAEPVVAWFFASRMTSTRIHLHWGCVRINVQTVS